ncbi:Transcriptional regulator [Pseudomonas syringae pv. delphinii]|uniref:Transcriptional regulator n=1 Tax=Pseudomonas syringae pv. delphinii TaxID=192088 RepID=A0A3M4AXJ2_9PSED|nr:Transcriptional regulator [Pseudomonas syringae pv. delphinii]RMQ28189.1 Transcriptional regulator [Pseudomonas syringae pv. delphinii]
MNAEMTRLDIAHDARAIDGRGEHQPIDGGWQAVQRELEIPAVGLSYAVAGAGRLVEEDHVAVVRQLAVGIDAKADVVDHMRGFDHDRQREIVALNQRGKGDALTLSNLHVASLAKRASDSPWSNDEVVTLTFASAHTGRPGRQHAPGQTRKGQALQPYRARPGQPGEKHAFTAEKHGFDATADHANIVVDRLGHGCKAAGIHIQRFARGQFDLAHRAAHVHEYPAITFELLQDKAFAAEQSGEDFFLKLDADGDALGAGQKTVFLADQLAAEIAQIQGQDGAGVGRSESDPALAGALLREHRGKQAFAGEHALAGTEQRTQQPGRLIAAVAENSLHLHVAGLVHHRPGFGDGTFAGIKFQLDKLGFYAV